MKKTFKLLVFTVMIFSILVITQIKDVNASSSRLLLNNLDFEATITQNGDMQVVEKWNINIEDTNTLFKTFKTDKSKYSEIKDVKIKETTKGKNQELIKTNQWKYHIDKNRYFSGVNNDRMFEISWGVGLDNDEDTRKYEISYTVKDAISKYSDYAELYWQFVGEDFEVNARKITGKIILPENAQNIEDIKVWGHTEDLNGSIYSVNTNTIVFNIDGFNSGRYVEVRTLFPTEMITSATKQSNTQILNTVINEETNWANEANAKRENKKNMQTMITVVTNIICLIICIFILKSIIKRSKESKQLVKIEPTQEVKYYREMPRENATPAEALSLYTKKIAGFEGTQLGKIFSATLLDLSLKKIIDFEVSQNEKGKESISIKILDENPQILEENKDENKIFEFLKGACKNNNEITVKELQKYIRNQQTKIIKLKDNINKETENSLYNKKLANKEEKKKHDTITGRITGYTVLILLSVFIFIFISGICDNIFTLIGLLPLLILTIIHIITDINMQKKINVLTQTGVDEANNWKALKNFMEDFSMLDKREVPEIIIWEKFLVYATVFGIADKVLKQLKIVYPNIEENMNINTYGYMYLMMHTDFSNSFSNAISTSMSTSYSSAQGGGGGFSGGRRWRPEAGGGGGGR